MTTRVGKYEIFCAEAGRGTHASLFICSITDLELGKPVEYINFRVWRIPDRVHSCRDTW
jgi:hypothetical protein